MTIDKLDFYIDLWNNFYKSETLKNVTIGDANNVNFGSYATPFYNMSGTIDVVMNMLSPEWSRLVTQVERDYFTGAPQSRVMERDAVISELHDRSISSITFRANISTRISRDSYNYVMQGGSSEIDGFIDDLTIVKYVTSDSEEHSGDELYKGSVFYEEVLLHFIDSLHKPTSGFTNSLRIIAKRKRT